MSKELSYIKGTFLINRVYRRMMASGSIDIPMHCVHLLFAVNSLPPPAHFYRLFTYYKNVGRCIGQYQLKARIDLLINRGYLERNGLGKTSITPLGVNLLNAFEAKLRKEKV